VEAGYPGANPTDTQFFAQTHPARTRVTAFGMTKRPGRSVSNAPGIAALLEAKADAICFVAKASAYQVRVALETTREENLASIRDSVQAAVKAGREALVDCEHFFDGYKEDPDFALACARAAFEAGARWVVLCDTNGGTLPHEVEAIVSQVVKVVPGDHLGIHAHNDTEQAVANSLAAVRAGARQIQGTLNGLGERCGNANLVSIIPTLKLKKEFADAFDIGVTDDARKKRAAVARARDDRALLIDAVLAPAGVNPEFVAAIEQGGPYGAGWPAPRIAAGPMRVVKADVVGNGHLRAIMAGADGRSIKTIAFRQAESAMGQAILGASYDRRLWVAGRAKIDDWGSRPAAELHLDDAAWAD